MNVPIRARVTIAFASVLAVVLLLVSGFVYSRFRADANNAVDAELRARTAVFFAARNPDPQLRINLLGVSDERFGQVVNPAGRVIARSAQLGNSPIVRPRPGYRFATIRTLAERRSVRTLTTRRDRTTLVLASALDDRNDALASLADLLWLGGVITFVIATLAAWLLARAALRPVERLRAAAGAYSARDLSGRLLVPPARDELHRLAVTLNEMLARIQESFDGQRIFVDRASHELRTPLANLSMELELALRRDRSVEEMRTALAGAAEEALRLDRLASNLLVLARTTDGRLPIAPLPTDLQRLVADTLGTFVARAESASVELVAEISVPDSVTVDPVRIRQALTNLIENSLRVTPAGGTVAVRVDVDGNDVTLRVSDTGPGFPVELGDGAFGMFVRGPSTSRAVDGAGLGLAIVNAVAEAHHGTVRIEPGGPGATVIMCLPRGGSLL